MFKIIFSLLIGVPIGLGIAMFIVVRVLKNNISIGDNKGEFESFSKFPIRIISQKNNSGLF